MAMAGEVKGAFNYQSDKVPCSLLTTGKVYVERMESGSDVEPVGLDPVSVEKTVQNGRGLNKTLDGNGFQLVDHKYDHVDYFDAQEVVGKYYPEVTRFLKEKLGAKHVYAFDHNIRCSQTKSWANKDGEQEEEQKLKNTEQTVQSSAGVVHNDYSVVSSKKRVEQLAEPAKKNDTWNSLAPESSAPLVPPEEFAELKNSRWAMVNLWRNIVDTPVEDRPLAMCDATTAKMDQLVTFEVRYSDRTGENYFVQHREDNQWYYFPKMVKDEAIMLKVWDTAGKSVRNLDYETAEELAQAPEGRGDEVPASFSFHSAFSDPTAREGCPARWSIEVRTVVVY